MLGDFNFHVDEPHKDTGAARFLELLNLHNLEQHVTVSTHRNNHTLDLVITRDDELVLRDYTIEDSNLSLCAL